MGFVLGSALAIDRELLGVSVRRLAREMGISVQRISAIEHGRVTASVALRYREALRRARDNRVKELFGLAS